MLTPGGVLVAATGVMMYNDHQANLNLANKLLAANRSGFSVIDQEFVTRYGNIDDVLDDPVALALYRDALNKEIEKKSVEFAMNSAAGGSQILWTPIAEERGPQILSTPIHSRAVEPLATPDERERLDDERKQELKTGGFRAHEGPAFETEGFDAHETDWRDNFLQKNTFEEGDVIDLSSFTEKIKGKVAWKDPKTGLIIEQDRSWNSGAGPHGKESRWKLFKNTNKLQAGKRIATVTEDGKILRK